MQNCWGMYITTIMDYNNIILPIFLEAKNGFINPFEKFDISHLIILLMNNILNYVLFV